MVCGFKPIPMPNQYSRPRTLCVYGAKRPSAVTIRHTGPGLGLLEVAVLGNQAVCGHLRDFIQVHEEFQGRAVRSAIFDVGHLHRDPWGRKRGQWASRLGLSRQPVPATPPSPSTHIALNGCDRHGVRMTPSKPCAGGREGVSEPPRMKEENAIKTLASSLPFSLPL